MKPGDPVKTPDGRRGKVSSCWFERPNWSMPGPPRRRLMAIVEFRDHTRRVYPAQRLEIV